MLPNGPYKRTLVYILCVHTLACVVLCKRWFDTRLAPATSPAVVSAPRPATRLEPDAFLPFNGATCVLPQKAIAGTHLVWDESYQWLSDHEVVLMRALPFDDEHPTPLKFVLCNIRTHKETALYALNATMSRFGLDGFGDIYQGWQFSPDKCWLMLQNKDNINVVHLNGTGFHRHSEYTEWSRYYWLDNTTLLSAGPTGPIDAPPSPKETLSYPTLGLFKVPDLKPAGTLTNTVYSPIYLTHEVDIDSIAVAQTTGKQLLTFNTRCFNCGEHQVLTAAQILVRDLSHQSQPSRSIQMPLFLPGRVVKATFSPDANQIAYVLLRETGKQGKDADDKVTGRLDLWVATWKTGASHLIGSIPCKFYPEVGYEEEFYPSDIQWLPDGKHLSFVYKDALWTIPVNPQENTVPKV